MSIEARTQTRRFRVTVITIGAVATLAAVWGIANASTDQEKSSAADHAATASQLRHLEQNQLQALVEPTPTGTPSTCCSPTTSCSCRRRARR